MIRAWKWSRCVRIPSCDILEPNVANFKLGTYERNVEPSIFVQYWTAWCVACKYWGGGHTNTSRAAIVVQVNLLSRYIKAMMLSNVESPWGACKMRYLPEGQRKVERQRLSLTKEGETSRLPIVDVRSASESGFLVASRKVILELCTNFT